MDKNDENTRISITMTRRTWLGLSQAIDFYGNSGLIGRIKSMLSKKLFPIVESGKMQEMVMYNGNVYKCLACAQQKKGCQLGLVAIAQSGELREELLDVITGLCENFQIEPR